MYENHAQITRTHKNKLMSQCTNQKKMLIKNHSINEKKQLQLSFVIITMHSTIV